MQTGLTVEKDNVTVDDMSFDNIANAQPVRDRRSVTELQELLEAAAAGRHVVRAGVHIAAVANRLLQHLHIMRRDALRVRQDLRNTLRHGDFVNTQIGIWRDDCSTREVDTLPG